MDSISDIAHEAFIYGLPTVDLYRILHDFALDPASPEFKAPLNDVFHSRRLADPHDRSIVAMNVDTPYSYAWLDTPPRARGPHHAGVRAGAVRLGAADRPLHLHRRLHLTATIRPSRR